MYFNRYIYGIVESAPYCMQLLMLQPLHTLIRGQNNVHNTKLKCPVIPHSKLKLKFGHYCMKYVAKHIIDPHSIP